MIDMIEINKKIGDLSQRLFEGEDWDRVNIQREGSTFKYRHWDRGILYTYHPDSGRLSIKGKLINLSINNYSIDTLGDLYFDRVGLMLKEEPIYDGNGNVSHYEYYYEDYSQGLDEVIDAMNQYIYELLGIREDIRTFTVTLIEFCYNVRTKNVEEYIMMFNLIFSWRDPAKYINYVEEKEKPPYSSFYIRSNKNYEDNSKAGTTANFYNKADETKYRISEGIRKSIEDGRPQIPHQVMYQNITADILRLEVICGHQALYKVKKDYGIGNTLLDYINPQLSRDVIAKRYTHLIGGENLSFYSYNRAKERIEGSNLGREKKLNLIKHIRYHKGACSRNPDSAAYRRRDDLAGLGIHWCTIPRDYGTDYLDSPINLLDWQLAKLGDLEDVEGIRNRRHLMARVEADMSNSVTVEEEEVIQIPDDIFEK